MKPLVYRFLAVEITDPETGEVRQCMAMVPVPRATKLAAQQYHEGEEYVLEDGSPINLTGNSARHAELNQYFQNLPESLEARFPSANHFRKWLLVEKGWLTESEIDCASEAMANQTAALCRSFDSYARISVHGRKVIIRRARSQKITGPRSPNGLSKAEWEKSWKDILELASQLVGVSPSQMRKEAKRIAS